jgi:hypothetical protein
MKDLQAICAGHRQKFAGRRHRQVEHKPVAVFGMFACVLAVVRLPELALV